MNNLKKRSIIPTPKPTITELLDYYLGTYTDLKGIKSSKVNKANAKVLRRYFGHLVFDEIRPKIITKYLTDRKIQDGISDNTLRRELGVLRVAIQIGLDHELIDNLDDDGGKTRDAIMAERVLEFISRFRPKAKKRTKIPSHDQLEMILSKLDGPMRNLAWVASRTAYRKHELINLKWSNVDFKRKSIKLENRKNENDLDTPMYRELYVFMHNLFILSGRDQNGYCFHDKNGKNIAKYNTYVRWRTAVRKAGFVDENGKHMFNFHDLRRYAIRYLQETYHFSDDMVRFCYSGHLTKDIFEEIYNGLSPDSNKHFREMAFSV